MFCTSEDEDEEEEEGVAGALRRRGFLQETELQFLPSTR